MKPITILTHPGVPIGQFIPMGCAGDIIINPKERPQDIEYFACHPDSAEALKLRLATPEGEA